MPMPSASDLFQTFARSYESRRDAELSLSEYLEACRDNPLMYASAPERILDAIGQPEFIRGEWLKPGAIVLDGGINRLPPGEGEAKGRLVGDVAYEEALGHVGAITPVPGGVGATAIAVLLRNAIVAAYQHAGLPLAKDAI